MGKKIQFTAQEQQEIISKYLAGQSLNSIGKDYGVSNRPIRRILQENNIDLRTSGESQRTNLIGQRFGKLTVISLDPHYQPQSGRHAKWLCRCDCGAIVSCQSNHLKEGQATACSPGCKHIIEAGTRFGALTVLYPLTKRSTSGSIIYQCQCDCGEIIEVASTELRAKRKTSCHKCKESYGETKIRLLLEEYNISFVKEKTFHDCKNLETGRPYRFDFYVDDVYLIEFDGEQHFYPVEYFGGIEYLETCQARDKKKNEYCYINNIPLIRIPYTIIDNLTIEDLRLSTTKYLI